MISVLDIPIVNVLDAGAVFGSHGRVLSFVVPLFSKTTSNEKRRLARDRSNISSMKGLDRELYNDVIKMNYAFWKLRLIKNTNAILEIISDHIFHTVKNRNIFKNMELRTS